MPKRSVKKKLARISKGMLVKWFKEEEPNAPWFTRQQKLMLLKPNDLGIVIGKDDTLNKSMNNTHFIIYWQRIGIKRSISFKDFQIVKRLT